MPSPVCGCRSRRYRPACLGRPDPGAGNPARAAAQRRPPGCCGSSGSPSRSPPDHSARRSVTAAYPRSYDQLRGPCERAVLHLGDLLGSSSSRGGRPHRRRYHVGDVDLPLPETAPAVLDARRDVDAQQAVRPNRRAEGHLRDQEARLPHVVNVELTSRGRSDIPRDAFDGGKPLCLDVGAPIVECLQVTTTPPDRPEPVWTIDGPKLLIGPSLIGRRQITVFSLLVDGPTPRLSPPEQSLVDVDLRRGSSSEPFIRQQRQVPLVALLFLLVAAGLLSSQVPQHGAVVALAWGSFAVAAGWMAYFARPPRR